MQKPALTIVVVALIAAIAGILIVPQLFADEQAPTGHWSADDEVELATEAASTEAGTGSVGIDRTAVDLTSAADPAAEDRVEVLLQGRVIDKFKTPIAGASVWLDFGRGGPRGGNNRQRRVPDPVQTDRDGRFAFQGQAFRNLRVSLQIAHTKFAPGMFDKDIGAVAESVDLGDLTLANGGQIRGRVTDLESNAIPEAELHMQPQNSNSLRFLRDRDRLLPTITTDRNGYYLVPHASAGDWSLTATATRHQEGRSTTFAVEEDQAVDVPDIRLGPGFEVTGYVRDVQGQPIAKANVAMRSEERARSGTDPNAGQNNGGGRGFAFGGFGRDYTTTTDEKGRFYLDHLPGVTMHLTVTAEGYLESTQSGIDTKLAQPLQITLQDGLKITAEVKDPDGTPVTLFAFRAVRLRALLPLGQAPIDPQEIFAKLRDGNLDEATSAQLRQQLDSMRGQFGGGRGGRGQGPGGPGQGGPGRTPSDLGRPERHPDGLLAAAGLEEGVYELHVQSPDHARYQSAEVELRSGAPTPVLQVALDPGVFVAGIVVDDKEQPVRGAHVELRAPSNGRGRGRQVPDPNATAADAAAQGQAMANMARQFMRQAAGAQITLEATTDGEGLFVIKHAPRGNYQLAADARGHADANTEAFDLQADRSGFELKLGSLGSLEGIVRGVQAQELADSHVAAVPAAGAGGGGGPGQLFGGGRGGNGGGRGSPFQTASVNADGSYHLGDLVPGDYIVRSWVGSPQDLMRELMPQFFAGSVAADVSIRGGEVTHFDLLLTRPQQGTVAGSVLLNGTAAVGFQVDLVRQDDGAAQNPMANMMRGGQGGRGRGFGASLQGTVATSGHFSIEKVPAGAYRLRVQSNRRGDTVYEEAIQVAADATIERDLVLTSHSLKGNVTTDDGSKVEDLDGRVSLLLGVATMPGNFNEVQSQVLNFNTRLQNGQFEFDTVQPGNYLLVLSVRGRERTSMPVVVAGDQTITVPAGKVSTDPAAGGAGNGGRAPAAGPGAGGARQRGGPGGQGGQGGGRQGGRQGGGRTGGGRTGQPNTGTPPGGG